MIRSRLFLHGQPLLESDLPVPGRVKRLLWRLLGGRWVEVSREDAANYGDVSFEQDLEEIGLDNVEEFHG